MQQNTIQQWKWRDYRCIHLYRWSISLSEGASSRGSIKYGIVFIDNNALEQLKSKVVFRQLILFFPSDLARKSENFSNYEEEEIELK